MDETALGIAVIFRVAPALGTDGTSGQGKVIAGFLRCAGGRGGTVLRGEQRGKGSEPGQEGPGGPWDRNSWIQVGLVLVWHEGRRGFAFHDIVRTVASIPDSLHEIGFTGTSATRRARRLGVRSNAGDLFPVQRRNRKVDGSDNKRRILRVAAARKSIGRPAEIRGS